MERRIVMPDRKARMKDINPGSPRQNAETRTILTIDHPHKLDLDVTALTPQEAARIILEHAAACRK
ncbi:MAG: hypothetical protein LRY51_08505 [Geovibrio sp.]|nr:hypothetical protein [Geovibrio sp.]